MLITGGFGFIGSHLIEELLKDKNNQIYIVDNLSSNSLPYDYLLNEIDKDNRITFLSNLKVNKFCESEKNNFDIIYHLASKLGPIGVLSSPGKIVKSIVEDTESLIDFCLQNNSKLINISTSEVYGGGVEGLCEENMNCIIPLESSPRLEYALGKLSSEVMLRNIYLKNNLKYINIRPFNITGPRQSGLGGFVLPRFIYQSMNNKDITIFGSGEQIRSFTNVKDLVSGIIILSKNGIYGETYNIGNIHNKTTINELADKVIKLLNNKIKKIYLNPEEIYGNLYKESNDKYSYSNKIKNLGWNPKYDLCETILETYIYMKKLPENLLKKIGGEN